MSETDALILTHGAGGDKESPLLVAVAAAFESAGYLVERVNLLFRQKRPTGPPRRGDAERDREGLKEAVHEMRKRVPGSVLLGGQSYGGRQSSILASENPGLVDGLLLLSYPLHPPGKPGNPRTGHFPGLDLPCVFAIGTRDPFGSLEELKSATPAIRGVVKIHVVESAGHDLRKGKGWDQSVLPSLFGEDV